MLRIEIESVESAYKRAGQEIPQGILVRKRRLQIAPGMIGALPSIPLPSKAEVRNAIHFSQQQLEQIKDPNQRIIYQNINNFGLTEEPLVGGLAKPGGYIEDGYGIIVYSAIDADQKAKLREGLPPEVRVEFLQIAEPRLL